MRRTRLTTSLAAGCVALALLCALACGAAWSGPEGDEPVKPKPPPGPKYANKPAGVSAAGPSGWKMVADKATVTEWTRLVTFYDPLTDTDAVLSTRKRAHGSLTQLMTSVRKDWAKTPALTVTSMRTMQPTGLQPNASVVVDATFLHRKKPKGSEPPPPAVTYRVSATYYLAPRAEFLLYAKAQATHWSRVRGKITALMRSIKIEGAGTQKPQGAGVYRDESRGFACRYPPGYTVVMPQRKKHIVRFEGLSKEDPILDVYTFRWDEPVDTDVQRLIEYYRGELGGETEQQSVEVGGRPGQMLTARADMDGEPKTFILAILKRGSEFFRIKVTSTRDAEGNGRATFAKFLRDFKLGPAPR